jgi:hypothetical protein
MIMCAFLGITAAQMGEPAPYVRVLGFSQRGITALKAAREEALFPHTGEKIDHPYQILEQRCDDLYGLFATTLEPAGLANSRRVIYKNA